MHSHECVLVCKCSNYLSNLTPAGSEDGNLAKSHSGCILKLKSGISLHQINVRPKYEQNTHKTS